MNVVHPYPGISRPDAGGPQAHSRAVVPLVTAMAYFASW
jgi:hypothetical protein